jgi:hypothetical protein
MTASRPAAPRLPRPLPVLGYALRFTLWGAKSLPGL